jgi:hypothetical protein
MEQWWSVQNYRETACANHFDKAKLVQDGDNLGGLQDRDISHRSRDSDVLQSDELRLQSWFAIFQEQGNDFSRLGRTLATPLICALIQLRKACGFANPCSSGLWALGRVDPLKNAPLHRPGKCLEVSLCRRQSDQCRDEVARQLKIRDSVQRHPRTVCLGLFDLGKTRWLHEASLNQSLDALLVGS